MKSMRKMQALKPQIDAINDKYKGIEHARSEEAASRTQEVMDLYKKHGVNPMGGCVPMAAADAVLLRVLQGVHGADRDARRDLAVGDGSFAARDTCRSTFCRSS